MNLAAIASRETVLRDWKCLREPATDAGAFPHDLNESARRRVLPAVDGVRALATLSIVAALFLLEIEASESRADVWADSRATVFAQYILLTGFHVAVPVLALLSGLLVTKRFLPLLKYNQPPNPNAARERYPLAFSSYIPRRYMRLLPAVIVAGYFVVVVEGAFFGKLPAWISALTFSSTIFASVGGKPSFLLLTVSNISVLFIISLLVPILFLRLRRRRWLTRKIVVCLALLPLAGIVVGNTLLAPNDKESCRALRLTTAFDMVGEDDEFYRNIYGDGGEQNVLQDTLGGNLHHYYVAAEDRLWLQLCTLLPAFFMGSLIAMQLHHDADANAPEQTSETEIKTVRARKHTMALIGTPIAYTLAGAGPVLCAWYFASTSTCESPHSTLDLMVMSTLFPVVVPAAIAFLVYRSLCPSSRPFASARLSRALSLPVWIPFARTSYLTIVVLPMILRELHLRFPLFVMDILHWENSFVFAVWFAIKFLLQLAVLFPVIVTLHLFIERPLMRLLVVLRRFYFGGDSAQKTKTV